jgi:pyrroloquinoline quinone biosynthesis protein D
MSNLLENSVPRFAPGFRLKLDEIREAYVVLGPERLFMPDEAALSVLKLIDGNKTFAGIIRDLAALYDAPEAEIGDDVRDMMLDFAARGALRW